MDAGDRIVHSPPPDRQQPPKLLDRAPLAIPRPFHHSGVYPAYCRITHLLQAGYDIRTIQERLGDNDLSATMIYTQFGARLRNRPGKPIRVWTDCLITVGADAARRANGAASSHPLAVPALRAGPTSGCSGQPAPRARSRARPPLSRGPVMQEETEKERT